MAVIDFLKPIALLLLASQLAACAVVSKTDCLEADWQSQGYEVGLAGDREISKAFAKREKRCAKYGAVADWSEFEIGYSKGLDEYCAVGNAVKLGAKGAPNAIETCPESEYFGFYNAYNDGYRLFQLTAEVREADSQRSRIDTAISNNQREVENLRRRLNASQLTEDDRRFATDRIRRLNRQLRNFWSQRRQLEDRTSDMRRAVEQYTKELNSRYDDDIE